VTLGVVLSQKPSVVEMASKKRSAPSDEFRLVLSPDPKAGARVRGAIRERFDQLLASKTLDDLMAVVTELVNNAVEHGPRRPITIALTIGAESIRGEVADQGNPAAAIPPMMEPPDSRPLGIDLVDKLTAAWAVYEGSTHVWFELPREE
jgi:anti-sigma regulatory factor (Ser/Thr protein kinase)